MNIYFLQLSYQISAIEFVASREMIIIITMLEMIPYYQHVHKNQCYATTILSEPLLWQMNQQ